MLKNRILPDGTKVEEISEDDDFYNVTEMWKELKRVNFFKLDEVFLDPKRSEIENAILDMEEEKSNELMNWKCEYYQDGACYWSNRMCDKTKREMEDCRGRLD